MTQDYLRRGVLGLAGAVDCLCRCTTRSSPPSHINANSEILMLMIFWPSLLVLQAVRMCVLSWKLSRTGIGSLIGMRTASALENGRAYGR